MDDKRLLIVEDDPGFRRQLQWAFDGIEVYLAEDRKSAVAAFRRFEPQVVLQDLGLPPQREGTTQGLETLREILALAPQVKVIVITGRGERQDALDAIAEGAWDYYEKPFEPQTLVLSVQRAFHIYELEEENRRLSYNKPSILAGIIANSEEMKEVCRTVGKIAQTGATTLLLGESGTGKELIARSIHALGPRKAGPFVAINCAAIPETLLESELFGYERGAFTGAVKRTEGKIECARCGTLFLDEIGDMPMSLQAKLLRFLQDRRIERLGGREEISVDVRVVCATNKDLSDLMKEGLFREDLYYRISEITIRIPPLRERGEDAILIARAFLENSAKEHGKRVKGFTQDALHAIETYDWPGNVRELRNRINSAVILAENRNVCARDLGLGGFLQRGIDELNLREIRYRAERRALQKALAIANGNISKSSALLGITRPTFYDLIKKHRLDG